MVRRNKPLGRPKCSNEWVLLSNVALPPRATVELYRLRWRVETVFRTLQTGFGAGLGRGKVHSILHTVSAACLVHTMCRLSEIERSWMARRRLARSGRVVRAWSRSSTYHRVRLVKRLTARLPRCRFSSRMVHSRYADSLEPPRQRTPHHHHERQHTLTSALHTLAHGHHPLLYSLHAQALLVHANVVHGVWPLAAVDSADSAGLPLFSPLV